MDVMTTAQWTTFLVTVGGILAGLLRYWSKVKNSISTDSTATEVNNQLLINLRDEITRLEGIIKKLNDRIGVLESNINGLRNLEIEGSLDFGALEMILEHMPCSSCNSPGRAFGQLRDVVDRMKKRRDDRHYLITNVNEDAQQLHNVLTEHQ